jgi:hypothetical protein
LAAYKHSVAPSLRSTDYEKTLIDVRGSGFNEVRSGLDVWWGQGDIKLGFAEMLTYSVARRYDNVSYQPGLIRRSTVTTGYQWNIHGKILFGANLELKERLRSDGEAISDSEQQNMSLFLTQDWQFQDLSSIRGTVSKQAAFGANRNTARFVSMTIGYFSLINP